MGRKPEGDLRRGWTTGACAAAAAAAAFEAMVAGRFPDPVTIRLPRGQTPSFALAEHGFGGGGAMAAIVKDAGDDPDVTHGALVRAEVRPAEAGSGIGFRAGAGVGTVTRPGLALPVGEPAINPAPRALIRETLHAIAERCGRAADAEVTVSIPGGEVLAERTANARLGILGGLSVLGTTGIVVPYSCAAWIHSIHRGIDVARAAGLDHVGAATGRTSEKALQKLYGLPDHAMLDMGDFAGAVLKYMRRSPLPRLSIAGGFGKLSKLAAGHLDLHSGRSQVDVAGLAELLADLGASRPLVAAAGGAVSAGEVLELAGEAGLDLAAAVARRARETALASLSGDTAVEVLVFARDGTLLGRAGG